MVKHSLFLLLFLGSCASRQEMARSYYEQHPQVLAGHCAAAFPIKERLLPGKETRQIDTIQVAGMVWPCPPTASGQSPHYVRCPDSKTITQKIYKTDTLVQENSARVADLTYRLLTEQHQYQSLAQRCAGYKKQAQKLSWAMAISLLIAIAYTARRLKQI